MKRPEQVELLSTVKNEPPWGNVVLPRLRWQFGRRGIGLVSTPAKLSLINLINWLRRKTPKRRKWQSSILAVRNCNHNTLIVTLSPRDGVHCSLVSRVQ
jgi:hypothetical protein